MVKALPEFVLLSRDGSSLWIDRAWGKTSIVDRFVNPDGFFSDNGCIVLKDQKKIKIGRIALEVAGQHRSLYIKRYNAFSIRSKLMSLFTDSGAVRSLRGAAILTGAGVCTAKPVAAVESRRYGMVMKSFYLSEEIVGGLTVDDYWQRDLASGQGIGQRRRFLRRLALIFKKLHRCGVYHNDLKDANIVVVPGTENLSFYFLDLEGVRRYPNLNHSRRIKNLVQLNRTLGRFIRDPDKLYFLKIYLDSAFRSRLEKRRWVREVLRQSRRRDLKTTGMPANRKSP